MKEKRLVPKRRFFGFNEAWQESLLGDIATEIVAGGDIDNKIIKKTGNYPVIANGQNNRGIVGYYDNQYRIEGPAVTITGRGDVGIAKARKENFTPVVRLISVKTRLDEYFLENFINRENILVESTGVPQLTVPQVSSLRINFPGCQEQYLIGSLFKKLDNLLELYEKRLSKLEKTKESYLNKMFPQKGSDVPEMRFEGFYGPWEVKNLGQLLRYKQPTEYLVSSDLYDDRNSVPVLTAGQSFILGYTSETFGLKKASVENPVIIFDDFTTSSHYVDFEFKVKSSALKILSAKNLQDNLYFLYYALNEIKYKPMNHQRHWISVFSEFEILTPSVEEQQLIGNFFKNLDDQIDAQERKLDKLREMKKAYLEEMFV